MYSQGSGDGYEDKDGEAAEAEVGILVNKAINEVIDGVEAEDEVTLNEASDEADEVERNDHIVPVCMYKRYMDCSD